MKKQVNFAIVGCGRIAPFHANGIKAAPSANLVAVCDIIEDKASSVTKEIEYEALKKDIVSMLNSLKDREQKVITMRFGLDGSERQTLEEIGKIYGVTKECIRQTEVRALSKLKNSELSLNLYENYVC